MNLAGVILYCFILGISWSWVELFWESISIECILVELYAIAITKMKSSLKNVTSGPKTLTFPQVSHVLFSTSVWMYHLNVTGLLNGLKIYKSGDFRLQRETWRNCKYYNINRGLLGHMWTLIWYLGCAFRKGLKRGKYVCTCNRGYTIIHYGWCDVILPSNIDKHLYMIWPFWTKIAISPICAKNGLCQLWTI